MCISKAIYNNSMYMAPSAEQPLTPGTATSDAETNPAASSQRAPSTRSIGGSTGTIAPTWWSESASERVGE